ncbi:MAG TPA: hypothetical protein VGQ00_01160 [Candidatus Norongarragalinales archaeon]|jgi:uncharacterized protein YjeT (DUF2065 family)|nr:hypothetical protein [Candidatus Norongarragalinales archaeon]
MNNDYTPLYIAGWIMMITGLVYAVLPHDLHAVLPFFSEEAHELHEVLGMGVVVLGVVVLAIDRRMKNR